MELWKDVKNYKGLYQVSNLGNVKSIDRIVKSGLNGVTTRTIPGRILKQQINCWGYCRVQLVKHKKQKKFSVHRLVAKAFIQNIHNKSDVNHIDSNRKNNKVNNLEWCTKSENNIHGFKYGNMNHKGENHNQSKLTDDYVRRIKLGLLCGLKNKELANIYNVSQSSISNIKRGKAWDWVNLILV